MGGVERVAGRVSLCGRKQNLSLSELEELCERGAPRGRQRTARLDERAEVMRGAPPKTRHDRAFFRC